MGANTATRLHGRALKFKLAASGGGAVVDLTGDTMEVSGIPGELEMGDVTTGGSTGHKHYPGLQKQSFTAKMLCNAVGTGAWATVQDYQTDLATRLFEFYPAGDATTGLPKYSGSCWIKSIDMPAKSTDLLIMTVHMESNNGVTQGVTS